MVGTDELAAAVAVVTENVGLGQAAAWDREGRLPEELARQLGMKGVLCAEVPTQLGGLGLSSRQNGELTAHLGSLCSSMRSLATSQGIAAWTIRRFGTREQQRTYLSRLTGGEIAGVAFSEPGAGSDLSAMSTEIRLEGDSVVVDGHKVWVTSAAYADLLVVIGRIGTGAGAVVVPTSAPGVRVERVASPLGVRAAGHANVSLASVRLPVDALLGAAGRPLPLALLATTALTYGRLSVAWGCVGILRACLNEAARHAKSREQFGQPLSNHQLVRRHLAELLIAEQTATRTCEHASACWECGSPEMVMASVLAKHVAATSAASSAAAAVQVLGSAGAQDGHPVARAYRDAKLMEIIEGTNEICLMLLADQALTVRR